VVALVLPSVQYERSFLAAERELGSELAVPFAELVALLEDEAAGIGLWPGCVPATTLWLVDDEEFIGRISIRHSLTEELRRLDGHIGYAIRPSRRRQGLGTRMLELALPHAHRLGIDPALITCDTTNIASRKIIERCGGIFADEQLTEDGSGRLRFWVPTGR
jgi:predicted acetyltransferase